MRQILRALSVSFLFLTCWFNEVQASHAAAGEIIYEYTGVPNQYLVSLRFFRDCSGISAPSSVTFEYFSPSNCMAGGVTSAVPGVYVGTVDDPCVDAGTSALCAEEWRYSTTITLPGPCPDWVFSYDVCCRNTSDNITNSQAATFFMHAELNNVFAPGNNSPLFNTTPIRYFCVGRQFYWSQSAIEADGDSLHYSLSTPYDNYLAGLPYNAPYNSQDPIPTQNGFNLDPATGLITFIPTQTFLGVVVIQVDEYRQDTNTGFWVKIGTIRRDMQVRVDPNCVNEDPSFPDDLNGNPVIHNAVCGDSTFVIEIDDTVQCGSISPDGTDFRMVSVDGFPMPVIGARPINCVDGLATLIEIKLYVPVQPLTGYWVYLKRGFDNNVLLTRCGLEYPEFDSAYVELQDCYDLITDAVNVTVVDDDFNRVMWEVPYDTVLSFPANLFTSYDVYRKDNSIPSSPFVYAGAVTTSINDTEYDDLNLPTDVDITNYTYYVIMTYYNGALYSPKTDSLTTIKLSCATNLTDTNLLNMNWTAYNGWDSANYVVNYRKVGDPNWTSIGTTSNTSFSFQKPEETELYETMVETFGPGGLRSESNWCAFLVREKIESLCMPNVFTPGGNYPYFNVITDGMAEETEDCKGVSSHLKEFNGKIYNRWGQLVYEWSDWENPAGGWDGGNASEGTYYYIVKAVGVNGTSFDQNGSFQLIRR